MPTSMLIAKYYHSPELMAETCQRCADGRRIDTAHDLADVLFLPPQRAVGLDSLRCEDGFQQVLVEAHRLKIGFLQRDQLFAELLQRKELAFFRAFAGL